jgi:anti-sigma factor RsiW
MSCAVQSELTAYVDGELDEPQRAKVEAHLSGCEECRAKVALIRGLAARVAELPAREPSPALRRAVLERVAAAAESPWKRFVEHWRTSWVWPSLAGAAVAVLLMILLLRPSGNAGLNVLLEPGAVELAANLEVVRDLDVVGVEAPEDLEVVANLNELEAAP